MEHIHKLALLLFSCFLLISCTRSSPQTRVQHLSHDMILQSLTEAELKDLHRPSNIVTDEDCNREVQKALCVSDQVELGYDGACAPERVTSATRAAVSGLIPRLPAFHRKVFCHLNRIQIQDRIFSIGYAVNIAVQTTNGPRKIVGTMIGIRSDVIEEKDLGRDFLSWKEQMNFGLTDPKNVDSPLSPQGPQVRERIQGENKQGSFTLSVLVHELNHIIDFLNEANSYRFINCIRISENPTMLSCEYSSPDAFQKLSRGDKEIFPEEFVEDVTFPPPAWAPHFPLLAQLCFYSCKQPLGTSLISAVYAELGRAPFVTSYATSSPPEDFAESALTWAFQQEGREHTYEYIAGDGTILYSSKGRLSSEVLRAKKDWLGRFFARPGLRYKAE